MATASRKPRVSLDWKTYAGGFYAREGAHSYDARGWFGHVVVEPPLTKLGRGSDYVVRWANTYGLAVRGLSSGLWHDVGKARTPQSAQARAREYIEKHLMAFAPRA
jgi:hypothetical protein